MFVAGRLLRRGAATMLPGGKGYLEIGRICNYATCEKYEYVLEYYVYVYT